MVKPIKFISLLFVLSIINCVSAQIKTDKVSNYPTTLAIDGQDLKKNYDLIVAKDADKVRALKSLLKKGFNILLRIFSCPQNLLKKVQMIVIG